LISVEFALKETVYQIMYFKTKTDI